MHLSEKANPEHPGLNEHLQALQLISQGSPKRPTTAKRPRVGTTPPKMRVPADGGAATFMEGLTESSPPAQGPNSASRSPAKKPAQRQAPRKIGTVEQGPFRKALPPVPRSEPYPAQPGNHGAMPHEPQVKPRGEGTGRSRKGKKRTVKKLDYNAWVARQLEEECEKVERKRARDQFLMAHADHWSLREQGIDVDARPEMSLRGVPSWSIGIDISMATVERERFDPRPLDYPDL